MSAHDERKKLFVITVASEKGGVGKTTIATNLAVYLKAINEDLPVTVASFDNHFSVDHMFAVGPSPPKNISDLLCCSSADEVTVLGQYGVQYIASEKQLRTPAHSPSWLRQRLQNADVEGILILDTKPVLDWHTEAALLAADLVITPIKDRAALINVAKVQNVLHRVGQGKRLWLLPSLVDTRARINAELKVLDFLVSAAHERNYQVLDFYISKSPKVESLAAGGSLRIHSVLNKARNTAVHAQLKQLADFVCQKYKDHIKSPSYCWSDQSLVDLKQVPAEQRRRLIGECPVCARDSLNARGYYFYDMRTRRKGLIHKECLDRTLDILGLHNECRLNSLIALTFDGPGITSSEGNISLHFFERSGKLVDSRRFLPKEQLPLLDVVANISGCQSDSIYREFSLLKLKPVSIAKQLRDPKDKQFRHLKKRALKELCTAGYY